MAMYAVVLVFCMCVLWCFYNNRNNSVSTTVVHDNMGHDNDNNSTWKE